MGRNDDKAITDLFSIKVNGTECTLDNTIVFPAYEGTQYFDWIEKEIMIIDLKAGDNVIVFTKTVSGLNFDYMKLTSAAVLRDSREVALGGHSYGEWNTSAIPTLESEGRMTTYCKLCRDFKEVILPVISEANGYTKNIITPVTATTFGEAEWTYSKDGVNETFKTKLRCRLQSPLLM